MGSLFYGVNMREPMCSRPIVKLVKVGKLDNGSYEAFMLHVERCRRCMFLLIKPGAIYRHYSGKLYRIVAISKDDKSRRLLVTYKGTDSQAYWTRSLFDFFLFVDRPFYKSPRFKEKDYRVADTQD